MFPYGVVLFAIALFACERVHAVPIEMKRVARDECDVCGQFDRDVFATAPQYQPPQQAFLPFGSWRDLSILLRSTHLRDFPNRFHVPDRETPTRPTSVPEPGTMALLLLGLGSTLLMRRRVRASDALAPR
jgi:hypothetical protein